MNLTPSKHLSVLIAISSVLSISACSPKPPNQTTATAPDTTSQPSGELRHTERPRPEQRTEASPLELMQNPQVERELKITNEQSSQIKKINDKFQQNIRQINANVNLDELKDDKKKQDELQEKMKNATELARAEIAKVLKPEQVNRFKEISLQIYGFSVVSYDEFGKEINLTTEQKAKLNKLRQETFNEIPANMKLPKDNSPAEQVRETNKKNVEKVFKKSNTQAYSYLTDAQKGKLESLKGKKFNFDPSQAPRN